MIFFIITAWLIFFWCLADLVTLLASAKVRNERQWDASLYFRIMILAGVVAMGLTLA